MNTTYSHLHLSSSGRDSHSLTELVGQINFVVGLHPLVVGVGFDPQDTSLSGHPMVGGPLPTPHVMSGFLSYDRAPSRKVLEAG